MSSFVVSAMRITDLGVPLSRALRKELVRKVLLSCHLITRRLMRMSSRGTQLVCL